LYFGDHVDVLNVSFFEGVYKYFHFHHISHFALENHTVDDSVSDVPQRLSVEGKKILAFHPKPAQERVWAAESKEGMHAVCGSTWAGTREVVSTREIFHLFTIL
jgi:hypothetical protein